jgi:hypothetical protein
MWMIRRLGGVNMRVLYVRQMSEMTVIQNRPSESVRPRVGSIIVFAFGDAEIVMTFILTITTWLMYLGLKYQGKRDRERERERVLWVASLRPRVGNSIAFAHVDDKEVGVREYACALCKADV